MEVNFQMFHYMIQHRVEEGRHQTLLGIPFDFSSIVFQYILSLFMICLKTIQMKRILVFTNSISGQYLLGISNQLLTRDSI